MTKQEIINVLERIRDNLSSCKGGGMDGFGIEGACSDISKLMFEINENVKEI